MKVSGVDGWMRTAMGWTKKQNKKRTHKTTTTTINKQIQVKKLKKKQA